MAIRLFIISLLCLLATVVNAAIPKAPNPPRLVNDLAGIMEPQYAELLERKLVAFDDSTSTQIAVVTVTTLDGYDIAQYAQELAQSWGIGRKENQKNNGVLILVCPPGQDGARGRAFIATGYGLEGSLPDILCSRIVNNVMVPYFKENKYSEGICAGAEAVMQYTHGEYTNENADSSEDEDVFAFIFMLIFFGFLLIFLLSNDNNNHRGKRGGMSSSEAAGWLLLNSLSNRGRGNSGWGNFSGGSGSFGGGGFGGFGGGSFGGGGGGGSW